MVLVAVCCVVMAIAMQSLANNILLDSLQPMARQSAKTVEANIHMLADRMMAVAGDYRMSVQAAADRQTGQADPELLRKNRDEGSHRRLKFMSCIPLPCMGWTASWCRGIRVPRPVWTAVFLRS